MTKDEVEAQAEHCNKKKKAAKIVQVIVIILSLTVSSRHLFSCRNSAVKCFLQYFYG